MARIRTFKPELPPVVAAEFRGFFFGEGHLDMCSPAGGRSLVPRARIALREDDVLVLEWVRSRFGGHLSRRASTRSWSWELAGAAAVGRVLAVLADGYIPSKKRREVELLREAVSLIPERGRHIGDGAATRLQEIRLELKAARRFAGVS